MIYTVQLNVDTKMSPEQLESMLIELIAEHNQWANLGHVHGIVGESLVKMLLIDDPVIVENN